MIGRVLRSSRHGKRTSQIANDFYEAGQHTLSSKSCGSASGRKNPCDDEPRCCKKICNALLLLGLDYLLELLLMVSFQVGQGTTHFIFFIKQNCNDPSHLRSWPRSSRLVCQTRKSQRKIRLHFEFVVQLQGNP